MTETTEAPETGAQDLMEGVPTANTAGVPLSMDERLNIRTLRRAIAATVDPETDKLISDRRFAVVVLGVNERHVRRMLAGDRGIRPWVLEKCHAAIQAGERRVRRTRAAVEAVDQAAAGAGTFTIRAGAAPAPGEEATGPVLASAQLPAEAVEPRGFQGRVPGDAPGRQ